MCGVEGWGCGVEGWGCGVEGWGGERFLGIKSAIRTDRQSPDSQTIGRPDRQTEGQKQILSERERKSLKELPGEGSVMREA